MINMKGRETHNKEPVESIERLRKEGNARKEE